jgi:hypothetical protein
VYHVQSTKFTNNGHIMVVIAIKTERVILECFLSSPFGSITVYNDM